VIEHCAQHATAILVREQINGKWGDYPLSQLPTDKRNAYIKMWWGQRRLPHAVTYKKDS